jgi:hypothetical protein
LSFKYLAERSEVFDAPQIEQTVHRSDYKN